MATANMAPTATTNTNMPQTNNTGDQGGTTALIYTTRTDDMPTQHARPRWYLIQCKPRQDARAEENLTRQAFTCYRPTHHVERLQRGRRTTSVESLFHGYLFIQLDQKKDNWHPIRSTCGVNKLVTFGQQPLAVANELIENLQQRLSNKSPESVTFEPGDRVRINSGSFKELEAMFVARDGEERAMILLQLLHREHTLSVPIGAIQKPDEIALPLH